MSQVEGTVTAVLDTDWKDKTLYSIRLGGDDTYYGTGETKPPVKEGDLVKFTTYRKGKRTSVEMDSIEVLKKGNGKASKKGSSDKDWDEQERYNRKNQRLISYQSARNSALQLLTLASTLGVFPKLPAKKEEGFTALESIVDEVTDKFLDDSRKYFELAPVPVVNEDNVEYQGFENGADEEDYPEDVWKDE